MHKNVTRAITALLVVVAISATYLFWAWSHPLKPGEETYLVKSGMTLRGFARELSQRGVLLESRSFVWLAYVSGHDRALKAGEYQFRDGMSARELLDQVIAGRVVEYPLVLVEGWTFKEFLQALDNAPKLTHTVTNLSRRAVMEKLGHPDQHPEGMFYPDTYYYSAGQTDLAILALAYEKMQTLLRLQWDIRDGNLPYKNPYEALILASIIEKETGRVDERRMVAGVFINRLRHGMKLQSDPTVIYGMGDSYHGKIRSKDLRQYTPYSTYTRAGLPPTPIAMPGKASLEAVLHPIDTRALYFVARGDGGHYFSETLVEHNNAVVKYQLNGKAKNFSSNPVPKPGPNTQANGAAKLP
jgi:UPF0755 protein